MGNLFRGRHHRPVVLSVVPEPLVSSEYLLKYKFLDFPGGTVDKNLPANAGDMGLAPGLRRFHIPQNN